MIKVDITSLTRVCYGYKAECWHHVTTRLVQTAQSSHTLQMMFQMMDKYWSVLSTEVFAPTVQCLQHRDTLDVGCFAHNLCM